MDSAQAIVTMDDEIEINVEIVASGPVGPQGTQGETGPAGPQGEKGDKGDKGDTGAAGATGPQGPKGDKGDKGDTGAAGATGATGATGPQGPAGVGVPTGGTTGQVLKKASGTDYDTEWANESGGGTTEVFWATYGSTSFADVDEAYQAEKVVLCKYDSYVFLLNEHSDATHYTFINTLGSTVREIFLSTTGGSSPGTGWAYATYQLSIPDAATATPSDLGTAAVGSSAKYAKEDHVHKMPTASDVGAYVKPSGGIPATDLASAVQTSLGKADTALQSYTETDPTVPSWAKAANKPSYTASEVGAAPAVTEVTISTAGAVSQALDPGKLYHFTGALSALTIAFNAAASGQIAQYHFDFDSGSTAPTVTLPNGVTMQGGTFAPEASKHYEVDILNNYGVSMAW